MGADLGARALLPPAGAELIPSVRGLAGGALAPGTLPGAQQVGVAAARSSGSPSAAATGSALCCCCCRHACLFFLMLFIYFRPRRVFMAVLCAGFSPAVASRGYSLAWSAGLSLRWLPSWRSRAPGRAGFSGCGSQARWLWPTGLVARRHVGSSRTRDRRCVSCIGRWVLYHH